MGAHSQMIVVMVLYLAFLVSWGIYHGKKVKNAVDYSIGGRRIPGWVAALSERATGESSWALLGLPGYAYAAGVASIWTALGCVAGIVTAWSAIAWRMRDDAERLQVHSFTDYLAKRHPETGQWIRTVGSLIIVFFFFFYVGAQFLGGGKTLHAVFGIDPKIGMWLTLFVIIPYTVYGGFQSVVYTDVVQALLMITTLLLGPLVGLVAIFRAPDVFAHSIPEALRLSGSEYMSWTGAASGFSAGILIVGGLSWFFGYLGGQPQLSMRFMSIRDSKQAILGRNIGILWTVLAYIGALSIGWIGLALFGPGKLEDPEFVMPAVMLRLFPPALAGILITGTFAAILSTADSLLILSANELTENIIKPIFRSRFRSPESLLIVSRFATAGLAGIALAAAFVSPSKVIYTLVGYVWAGIGGTFSVVVLLTLFWKRFHGRAVLVTMIGGLIFTVFWIQSGLEKVLTSRVTTFAAALVLAVVSTFLLRKRKNE